MLVPPTSVCCTPVAADAVDHLDEIVGAAEVRDVERRTRPRAAAGRQAEALAARAGFRDRAAGTRFRTVRRRPAPRLVRRLLHRRAAGALSRGVALGRGIVISGALAAGGRTASRFASRRYRPGPGGRRSRSCRRCADPSPPPREIVITVVGASVVCAKSHRPVRRPPPRSAPRARRSRRATIFWRPSGSRMRSRSTSLTSITARPGRFVDNADLLDAGALQSVEDVHQILHGHAAVAAQIDLLVGVPFHLLPHPLLQDIDAHLLIVQVDGAILPERAGTLTNSRSPSQSALDRVDTAGSRRRRAESSALSP